jgi:hypothetical protein
MPVSGILNHPPFVSHAPNRTAHQTIRVTAHQPPSIGQLASKTDPVFDGTTRMALPARY